MNDLDMFIAQTQRTTTYYYMGLFGVCIVGLIAIAIFPTDSTAINATIVTLLTTGATTLANLLMQQSNFWFARSRGGGVPDPAPPANTGEPKEVQQ